MWDDEEKRLLQKRETIRNVNRLEELRIYWFQRVQYILSHSTFCRHVRFLKAFMGETDFMTYVYDSKLAKTRKLFCKKKNQWNFYISQKYTSPGTSILLKWIN